MPITIHDIAAKAGVSHTTVSRVINKSVNVSNTTKKKVENAIIELNYVPNAYARGLSSSKTDVIGLVIPEIRNPFFGEIIQGVTSVADENGLNVLLFNTDESVVKEQRALRILQEHRIRGLIITPATGQESYDKSYVELFARMKMPIVLVDRNIMNSSLDGIYYDDMQGINEATTLLLSEGHRDIVILGGNPKLTLALNRVAGFVNAFKAHDIPLSESNIYYGDFTRECAYKQTLDVLNRTKRPTAIVATNNMLTIGCLKALFANKLRIPDDMAFVGYDKIELLDVIQSNITIVERQEYEYGQNAMHLLLRRMENPKMAQQRIIMSPTLKRRGSEKLVKRP